MSQWIISKGFIEEITLGLKGKRPCLAKRHIRQVLLDWTKKKLKISWQWNLNEEVTYGVSDYTIDRWMRWWDCRPIGLWVRNSWSWISSSLVPPNNIVCHVVYPNQSSSPQPNPAKYTNKEKNITEQFRSLVKRLTNIKSTLNVSTHSTSYKY